MVKKEKMVPQIFAPPISTKSTMYQIMHLLQKLYIKLLSRNLKLVLIERMLTKITQKEMFMKYKLCQPG